MKCPNCQVEIAEGLKFCGHCGSKLELQCPECAFKNPFDFNFCGYCGEKLCKQSIDKLNNKTSENNFDKLQQYLPDGLKEQILSEKESIEGEQREVTIMFCDIKGFTPLTESLGPENTFCLMDKIFEILIKKVNSYKGTVNELRGDGILAFFGAPIALENATQCAINSAIDIHEEIGKLNYSFCSTKKIDPILLRIGINTGPVVLGSVGYDLRVKYTAVGDTINMASRMESIADPGTTFVTENTYKIAESFFHFEFLGAKLVKGKKEAINVYKVIKADIYKTRFDVSVNRGLTPFIARVRELELLLDGFERCKAGRGQSFSIISEAGIGKSRLLYEFRSAIKEEKAFFLEGKCLSYSSGIAYYPFTQMLKDIFDINQNESDDEIANNLKNKLDKINIKKKQIPYFLELLSVENSGIDQISMSPGANKDRIMEALKLLVIKSAELKPTILAFEDLHWVDKSTEETIKYLLDSIAASRVLMIFTYRPEYVHDWGRKSYYNQINLNRLSNREIGLMATSILKTEKIDTDLERFLIEKSEGVPFFIEEFISSLLHLNIMEKINGKYGFKEKFSNFAIPSTIQDIIMAKVDSIPKDAKEVLQAGAVIEREFDYKLIREIINLDESELLAHLSILKDYELIYEKGICPESSYIFKHALTREVLYRSILSSKRIQLHEKIGEAIENIYKDNLSDYYGDLIEHFIGSSNFEKGAYYCKLAGKKAMRSASVNNAIDFMKKQVNCLEKLPQAEEVERKIIDARTALGHFYFYINYHIESKESVEPIITLTKNHGNKKRLSQIYTILGTYYYTVDVDFKKAFKYLRAALQFSEEINDLVCKNLSAYWLGYGLTFNCNFDESLHYLNKAMEISKFLKIDWGTSLIKSVLSHSVYFFQGKFELLFKSSYEAFQLAEESGDIYSRSMANAAIGLSHYCKTNFQEAIRHFELSSELSNKIGHYYSNSVSQFFLGELYYEMKDYQKSRDHFQQAIRLLNISKCFPYWTNLFSICLERTESFNDNMSLNLARLASYDEKNNVELFTGSISRYICEILINLGRDYDNKAEKWICNAISADKNFALPFHLGQDYVIYAKLLKKQRRLKNAKEKMIKAITIFKNCSAYEWADKVQNDFNQL